MRKLDFLILLIILVMAFAARLYRINAPLADLHSWRQVDTSAVSRNFVRNGIDLFHPKYDDLSSIETGIENPEGHRFVEFPLYNAIVAVEYRLFPAISLEIWGRVTTALASLLVIAVIYYLALKEVGRLAAIFSALIYAVFPFYVFFSRVILPESTALAFAFLSIFFTYLSVSDKHKKKRVLLYLLGVTGFMLALLVKPTALFYGLPLLYILSKKLELKSIKNPFLYLFFILAGLPFLLWRLYIRSYPEGIPASDWLITSVNTYQGLQNIFFRPAFFRWIFFERIVVGILGGFMSFFMIFGILHKSKTYFLHFIYLATIIYLFTFQGGNVQHEYYQTIILPAVALMSGVGMAKILTAKNEIIPPMFAYPVIIFFTVLALFFSVYRVKDFYYYPKELSQIGQIVHELTNDGDKIVTDRLGDTTLLYLIDRKGAPAIYKDPPELKTLGYTHLLTLNKETALNIATTYKYDIVFENDEFTLFKL